MKPFERFHNAIQHELSGKALDALMALYDRKVISDAELRQFLHLRSEQTQAPDAQTSMKTLSLLKDDDQPRTFIISVGRGKMQILRLNEAQDVAA